MKAFYENYIQPHANKAQPSFDAFKRDFQLAYKGSAAQAWVTQTVEARTGQAPVLAVLRTSTNNCPHLVNAGNVHLRPLSAPEDAGLRAILGNNIGIVVVLRASTRTEREIKVNQGCWLTDRSRLDNDVGCGKPKAELSIALLLRPDKTPPAKSKARKKQAATKKGEKDNSQQLEKDSHSSSSSSSDDKDGNQDVGSVSFRTAGPSVPFSAFSKSLTTTTMFIDLVDSSAASPADDLDNNNIIMDNNAAETITMAKRRRRSSAAVADTTTPRPKTSKKRKERDLVPDLEEEECNNALEQAGKLIKIRNQRRAKRQRKDDAVGVNSAPVIPPDSLLLVPGPETSMANIEALLQGLLSEDIILSDIDDDDDNINGSVNNNNEGEDELGGGLETRVETPEIVVHGGSDENAAQPAPPPLLLLTDDDWARLLPSEIISPFDEGNNNGEEQDIFSSSASSSSPPSVPASPAAIINSDDHVPAASSFFLLLAGKEEDDDNDDAGVEEEKEEEEEASLDDDDADAPNRNEIPHPSIVEQGGDEEADWEQMLVPDLNQADEVAVVPMASTPITLTPQGVTDEDVQVPAFSPIKRRGSFLAMAQMLFPPTPPLLPSNPLPPGIPEEDEKRSSSSSSSSSSQSVSSSWHLHSEDLASTVPPEQIFQEIELRASDAFAPQDMEWIAALSDPLPLPLASSVLPLAATLKLPDNNTTLAQSLSSLNVSGPVISSQWQQQPSPEKQQQPEEDNDEEEAMNIDSVPAPPTPGTAALIMPHATQTMMDIAYPMIDYETRGLNLSRFAAFASVNNEPGRSCVLLVMDETAPLRVNMGSGDPVFKTLANASNTAIQQVLMSALGTPLSHVVTPALINSTVPLSVHDRSLVQLFGMTSETDSSMALRAPVMALPESRHEALVLTLVPGAWALVYAPHGTRVAFASLSGEKNAALNVAYNSVHVLNGDRVNFHNDSLLYFYGATHAEVSVFLWLATAEANQPPFTLSLIMHAPAGTPCPLSQVDNVHMGAFEYGTLGSFAKQWHATQSYFSLAIAKLAAQTVVVVPATTTTTTTTTLEPMMHSPLPVTLRPALQPSIPFLVSGYDPEVRDLMQMGQEGKQLERMRRGLRLTADSTSNKFAYMFPQDMGELLSFQTRDERYAIYVNQDFACQLDLHSNKSLKDLCVDAYKPPTDVDKQRYSDYKKLAVLYRDGLVQLAAQPVEQRQPQTLQSTANRLVALGVELWGPATTSFKLKQLLRVSIGGGIVLYKSSSSSSNSNTPSPPPTTNVVTLGSVL